MWRAQERFERIVRRKVSTLHFGAQRCNGKETGNKERSEKDLTKGDDCASWKRSQRLVRVVDVVDASMRIGSFVNQPQLSLQRELEVDASVAAWLCKCRQGLLSHPSNLPALVPMNVCGIYPTFSNKV